MAKTTNQRGRPTKPPKEGEKVTLSLRVTPSLKVRLEAAGGESGRNLSQEAEYRLERSFHGEGLLLEALDLAYGSQVTGLLLLLARVIQDTGRSAGFSSALTMEGAAGWLNSPYAYDQGARAIAAVLEDARPEGSDAVPAHLTGIAGGLDIGAVFQNIGPGVARSALMAIAGRSVSSSLDQWAKPIRERLGPEIVARIAAHLDAGEAPRNG